MNIFNNPNVQRLTQVFKADGEPKNKIQSPQRPQKSARSDSVDLSTEGKVLFAIKQRLAEAPDVRSEKVAALRQAIADGTYQVSGEDIAERMIQEGKLP